MGKIKKLVDIMNRMCDELGIQEGVDITLEQNPARIYFTFENRDGESYLNTKGVSMRDVFEITAKYELQRDRSNPKHKEGNKFVLGFRLKSVQGSLRRYR